MVLGGLALGNLGLLSLRELGLAPCLGLVGGLGGLDQTRQTQAIFMPITPLIHPLPQEEAPADLRSGVL